MTITGINWKHVAYFNSARFLRIMKEHPELGFTQEQIEEQEQIVAKCKAEYENSI